MVRQAIGRRGVTLAEVMIVTAIIGIIGLIVPKLMQQMGDFFFMNRARLEIQREGRMITETVGRHLRQAQAGTIVLDQAAGQPWYSRLSFRKQSRTLGDMTPGESVQIWQRSHQGCGYAMFSSGELAMQVSVNGVPGPVKVLSENIRFVSFSFPRSDDNTMLSFSLSMEKSSGGGKAKALHVTSEKISIMNPVLTQ